MAAWMPAGTSTVVRMPPTWSARTGSVAVLASSAGAFFVRSYERGERVHLAMLSRGYTGSLPGLTRRTTRGREWAAGLTPALLAAAAAVLAWGMP